MFDQESKRLRILEFALVKFSNDRKLRIGERQYDTLSEAQIKELLQEQEKNLEVGKLVLQLMTVIQELRGVQAKLRDSIEQKSDSV